MNRRSRGNRRLAAGWIAVIGLLTGNSVYESSFGEQTSNSTTAERFVAAAREAQQAGETSRYFAFLREAIRVAPDYELARWQLGQVKVDGEWLTAEEAQRRAATDPRQAEYRQRREAQGETPQGQLDLARWCQKNGLADESRFHWASVLTVDPNNEEALRAVDMRWQNGRLMSRDEIELQKEQLRASRRAAKQWAPRIAKWRRDVSSADEAKRDTALDEIRGLSSTDAIPALETVTLGRDAARKNTSRECRQICLAFLEALTKMADPAATESLVRHAVFSPAPDARKAAIDGLKKRPPHDYMPLLLSSLAMPIESSFQVTNEPDGSVHYTHSLYREGAEADWSYDARLSAVQSDLRGRRYTLDVATNTIDIGPPTGTEAAAMRQKANVAARYQQRFGKTATATELQVWQANERTEALNALVIEVLALTTGRNFQSPKAWWEWWRAHNEYDGSQEKPVDKQYYAATDNFYYGFPQYNVVYPPPPPPPPGFFSGSCFARGTLVWTKIGQRPIEELVLGDLVLSQDVDTGELRYKPVIGRTVRPPTQILKLTWDGEALRTTRGHPLWVEGIGWRMAKELGDGALLHGVTASPRVASVNADGEEEAFNLVVADFNTYFVGESGILVHDNTPRRPTAATLPGLVAE